MQRFFITNPKFSGTALLDYNKNNVLCKIDCSNTDMDAETITAFKRAAPSSLQELEAGKSFSSQTVCVQGSYDVTFEMFWKKYNKKVNRIRAEKLWAKTSKTDQVLAFVYIDAYSQYLKKEQWLTKADPDTYLKNKRWLDNLL